MLIESLPVPAVDEPLSDAELVLRALAEAAADDEARGLLLERYAPLIRKLARHFAPRPDDVDDFLAEAQLAFLAALPGYSPATGAISTFIKPRIKHALKLARSKYDGRPKLSKQDRANLVKYRKFVRQHPEANRDEIASGLGLTWDAVLAVEGYDQHVASLESVVGAEDGTDAVDVLEDTVASDALAADGWDALEGPDESFEQVELRQRVQRLLALLTQTQREVITLRYGLDAEADDKERSGNDVAVLLGVTRQAVSKTERRAIERLREATKTDHEWMDYHPKRSASRCRSNAVLMIERELRRLRRRWPYHGMERGNVYGEGASR